jgi:hypothetical protein
MDRLLRVLSVFGLAVLLAAPATAQDLTDPAQRRVDPEVEAAIRRGLDYLRTTQKPSGAWEASFGEATSVTSLAVMAFLACGHVPGVDGPYRDAIDRGIRFVVASQKPNGLLVASSSHGPMYCHGISALMLAEVVGMMPDEAQAASVRAALGRAITLILQAQAVSKGNDQAGGWRYQPTSTDSDLSVTGWQVMALRAARNAGMPVGAEPIDRAIAYVKRCATADGGFAYQPGGGANNPRTGVGILALELCGAHLSPEAVAGGAYLAENPPGWSTPYFFYEVYYCTQALFQLGDDAFRPYHARLVAILLDHQDDNGSWLSGDSNDRTGGRAYCTAMAILALAIEYRYLPIYQR